MSRFQTRIILFGILIFAIALRLIFFVGLQGIDDIGYINQAWHILNNGYQTGPSLFQLRIGISFPLVWLYSIFGANEFASSLYPLIFSLGEIVLIFLLAKRFFDEKVGLLAAFLLSFSPLEISYSTSVYPDIPLAVFTGASVLLFLKGDELENKWSQYLFFFVSGFLVGLGYLIKESALLISLFYLGYIVLYRRFKLRYLLIGLGVTIVFLLEGCWYFQQTGKFLYHIVTTTGSYIDVPIEKQLESFLAYPYYMFINFSKAGFFYHFVLIAIVYLIFKRNKGAYVPILWLTVLFFYLQFGSRSLTTYKPCTHNARYLILISLPAIILLAAFLSQAKHLWKGSFSVIALSFLFITSIFLNSFNMIWLKEFTCLPKETVRFLKTVPVKEVYTDFHSRGLLNYFLGFKDYQIKLYISHKFLKRESFRYVDFSKLRDVYVVLNWEIINNYKENYLIKFPEIIFHPPKSWQLIKRIEPSYNQITLWGIESIKWILQSGTLPYSIKERMLNTLNTSLERRWVDIYYLPKQ